MRILREIVNPSGLVNRFCHNRLDQRFRLILVDIIFFIAGRVGLGSALTLSDQVRVEPMFLQKKVLKNYIVDARLYDPLFYKFFVLTNWWTGTDQDPIVLIIKSSLFYELNNTNSLFTKLIFWHVFNFSSVFRIKVGQEREDQ